MSNLHVNKLTVGLRVTGGGVVPVLFFLTSRWSSLEFPVCCQFTMGQKPVSPGIAALVIVISDRLDVPCPEQFLGYILETTTLSNSLSQQCCLLCRVFLPPPATKVQFPLQASCLIPIYKVRSNALKALLSVTHPGLNHN